MQEFINASAAAIQDVQVAGINLATITPLEFQERSMQTIIGPGVVGGIRLVGLLGPHGFSAIANVGIKMGLVGTVHEISRRFGQLILRGTRIMRVTGKALGVCLRSPLSKSPSSS